MTDEEINNNFKYHELNNKNSTILDNIRSRCKWIVGYINEVMPECREKSLAITKFEEAMMWANAGIARQGEKENGSG